MGVGAVVQLGIGDGPGEPPEWALALARFRAAEPEPISMMLEFRALTAVESGWSRFSSGRRRSRPRCPVESRPSRHCQQARGRDCRRPVPRLPRPPWRRTGRHPGNRWLRLRCRNRSLPRDGGRDHRPVVAAWTVRESVRMSPSVVPAPRSLSSERSLELSPMKARVTVVASRRAPETPKLLPPEFAPAKRRRARTARRTARRADRRDRR